MATTAQSRTLPIVPLPTGLVLLPGTSARIPLTGRADVASLLAHIYSKAATPRPEATGVTIGCVPLNSPYLSPDGKRLIEDAEAQEGKRQSTTPNPGDARKPDLFQYGTVARVTGVQGRTPSELTLVVEGTSRFKIEKITNERPYFEAKVTIHLDEAVREDDQEVAALFAQVKQLSRELIALIRLSAILPRARSITLSPILARRLELYIVRKNLQEAGVLADFMTNIVDCTHEDKLRILSALAVPERLERIVEILQRSIGTLQGNAKVVTITQNMPQDNSADSELLNRLRRDPRLRGWATVRCLVAVRACHRASAWEVDKAAKRKRMRLRR